MFCFQTTNQKAKKKTQFRFSNDDRAKEYDYFSKQNEKEFWNETSQETFWVSYSNRMTLIELNCILCALSFTEFLFFYFKISDDQSNCELYVRILKTKIAGQKRNGKKKQKL